MKNEKQKTALVILSDGFEDIEAVAPIDVLTRSGVAVTIASLGDDNVAGAYGTTIVPHKSLELVNDRYDAIVLPGGKKNAETLAAHPKVRQMILEQHKQGRIVAAICASPSHVLAEAAGILKGRRATGDPSFNDRLKSAGAIVTKR